MSESDNEKISIEVRSILESVAKILSLKKDVLKDLKEMDGLAIALCGEMLGSMLRVPLEIEADEFTEQGINPNYLLDLVKSGEDSFIQHKGSEGSLGWIDVLAANQDKMVGMFAGGLIG